MVEMQRARAAGSGAASDALSKETGATDTVQFVPHQGQLVAELDALFSGLWPGQLRSLFDPDRPKPLAIGIGAQIAEQLGMDTEERKHLGRLLGRWCGRLSYLKALRDDGAMRHGLDGQPLEPVSREHALGARQRIHRIWERIRAQAEAQARACAGNAAKPVLRLGARQ